MADNPFAPPKSELGAHVVNESGPGSVAKAVAIGATVDIVGSIVLGIAVLAVYIVRHMTPDMSTDDWMALLDAFQAESLDLRSIWTMIGVSFGLGMSVVGGYVCARVAQRRWPQAVFVLAVVMMLFGIISTLQYYPLALTILLSLAAFPAIFFGGWLYSLGQGESVGMAG